LLSEWGFTHGIDNEGKLDGSISYRKFNGQPRGPYLNYLKHLGLADLYVAEHAPEHLKLFRGAYTTCLPDDAYCDNWLSENGLNILRNFSVNQPWHLVVNFTGPHDPMEVTQSMRERWEQVDFPSAHQNTTMENADLLRNRQNYAAMIENIDRQVGRFLDLVIERGELDHTLVVYASDHGEMLGDHNRWGKGTWFSPSTCIPLIVCGPRMLNGVASNALVSLHDLTATFLDYAGAAALPEMDSISLRPFLEGKDTIHRPQVFSGLDEWRMVYDGRFKLVEQISKPPMLFDLAADPFEDNNITVKEQKTVANLSRLLENTW
jgi:hypothetical protein